MMKYNQQAVKQLFETKFQEPYRNSLLFSYETNWSRIDEVFSLFIAE